MQTKTSFHYHDNPCIDYFFKKGKKKIAGVNLYKGFNTSINYIFVLNVFVSSGVEALNHTGYGINHGHLLQQWQG